MIHKYKLNGFMIVLDVCSGAIYSVDQLTYDILDFLDKDVAPELDKKAFDILKKKYNENDIKEAYGEIRKAYLSGKIFSKDIYEDLSQTQNLNSPIKAMCLNVAHDCNMVCKYCFASEGDFGLKRELMSFDTAKNAIDFLVERSKNRKNLEVEFFGGEPLMAFDTIKKTVLYARSLEKKYNKLFRFTITTNGLLLDDEKIDFINNEMYTVVLSLDGRKNINDNMRKTKVGTGTYDIIVPKFKKLIQKRNFKNYHIRGTFTKNNLNFSDDVLHIYGLGFDKISIEPVVGDKNSGYSITDEELDLVLKEYEKLAQKILNLKKADQEIDFYRFNMDLKRNPCATKRLKGCSCGNEFIAVTPNGDVFPCHQFVGDEQFLMGNINSLTFNEKMKEFFSETNLYKKQKCSTCWAKLFCAGGCNANNFHFNSDLKKPHHISCEIEKKRIECALMLNVALNKI